MRPSPNTGQPFGGPSSQNSSFQIPQPYGKKKDEILAAILSFVFTGLGQVYNGQIDKGIVFILVGISLPAVAFLLVFATQVFAFLFLSIAGYLVLWAYNIYDAYDSAQKINAGLIRV